MICSFSRLPNIPLMASCMGLLHGTGCGRTVDSETISSGGQSWDP